jgi:hypothetical protein
VNTVENVYNSVKGAGTTRKVHVVLSRTETTPFGPAEWELMEDLAQRIYRYFEATNEPPTGNGQARARARKPAASG